jgi:hypothetical protein
MQQKRTMKSSLAKVFRTVEKDTETGRFGFCRVPLPQFVTYSV